MSLYPKVATKKDPRWGQQEFKVFRRVGNKMVEDPTQAYKPIPLDSPARAKARMLAALENDATEAEAKAAALNGADEIGTVDAIYAELAAEATELSSISKDATEEEYSAAVRSRAVDLNPEKWVAAVAPVLTKRDVEPELVISISDEDLLDIDFRGA